MKKERRVNPVPLSHSQNARPDDNTPMIIRKAEVKAATPLTYLQFKTVRAKEHLDEIDAEVRKIFDPEPYAITRQDRSKEQRHIIRVQSKAIPIQIPQLVGEFAFCLRSGLDQLAWALARQNVQCPRRETSFPIRDSAVKGLGDAVKDIPAAAVSVIDALQPYQRGNAFRNHPLWILNRLCNIDKHRTLAVRCTEIKGRVLGVSESDWIWKDLDYGVEIRVDIRNRNKVKFEPASPELILGEPVPNCYGVFEIGITKLIHDFVRDDVIPKFSALVK